MIHVHVFMIRQAGLLKDACGADYDATTMGRMLFHGTEAVEAIINSTDGHGFLPLLAGARNAAQFGNGVYFEEEKKRCIDVKDGVCVTRRFST